MITDWPTILIAGIVPAITIIGFWMTLSGRLAKAEVVSTEAKLDAKEASERATLLASSFGLYREQIAREYIQREVMREVEDRLTAAIDRLGDRLDKFLLRAKQEPQA